MISKSQFKLIANQLKNSFSTTADAAILTENGNGAVKIVLNKPKSLNALDLDMIRMLQPIVNSINTSNSIKLAVFTGAGKAFCAGGDVKGLYDSKDDPDRKMPREFFREEYLLDNAIANMKPYQVALWDGFVMGGGVGVSIHAPIRVATENAKFAMPEAKIGLFTDVAGGYFLSRLENNIGYYLGLTGQRLTGKELVQAGLADYYVKSENLQSLERALLDGGANVNSLQDAKKIVEGFHEPVQDSYKFAKYTDKHFGKGSVEEILKSIESDNDNAELSETLLKNMKTFCPISMKVIHEQIKRGKTLSLAENFNMDYRIAVRFMYGADFFEGVRCTLIDRNDTPKFSHASVADVKSDDYLSFFEKLPQNEELSL